MFDQTEEDIDHAPIIKSSPNNCTVVSLLPFALKENKPAIIPGYFQIPPVKSGQAQLVDDNGVRILHVGESIYWMESPFKGMPPIKITETPRAMCRSIVNDFIEAQLAVDQDAYPGLFWIEGEFNKEDVLKKFAPQIEKARKAQNRWFINLVRIADNDWEKSHNHNTISDIQRYAAKHLGMEKDWTTVTLNALMIQCPLCKELVRPDAIVHATCGYVIKPDEYAKLTNRIVPKSVEEQLRSIGQ